MPDWNEVAIDDRTAQNLHDESLIYAASQYVEEMSGELLANSLLQLSLDFPRGTWPNMIIIEAIRRIDPTMQLKLP